MVKFKRKTTECTICNKHISTNNMTRHIVACKGPKIELVKNGDLFKCPFCENEYSKFGIKAHIWKSHTEEGRSQKNCGKRNSVIWNKGLTKYTSDVIKQQGERLSKRIKSGEIIHSWKNKHHTVETKQKLSDAMKLAHREGRAWNIGKSRWNNLKSYPETFFEKVINNEFTDTNYICEYPIGIYSLDFAWPHLKKAIEIDGEQHIRFKEYADRDIRKDNFCQKEGWEILRIPFKELFNNTKLKIKDAKNFIDF